MGLEINNMPIQMIAAVNTTGDIQPIRFRFEDTEHLIKTVEIEKTLSSLIVKMRMMVRLSLLSIL